MICPNPRCNKSVSVLDSKCSYCGLDLSKPNLERSYDDVSKHAWIADGGEHPGQASFQEVGAKDVYVEIDHWNRLNWSLIHYGVPLVNRLTISNISSANIENIHIRIKLAPEYGDLWEQSVQTIPKKKNFVLEHIDIPISLEKLRSVKESEQAYLKTEISSNGNNLFSDTKSIAVHAYNEWYFHPLISESLAGFILPNSEAVIEIIKHLDPSISVDGYQSGNISKIEALVSAIYIVLNKRLRIKYITPPASFEKTGQKILLPEDIMNLNRGTCLDLALLYAACIERINLYPLVFLVPGHALLGLWMKQDDHDVFWANEKEIEERKIQRSVKDKEETSTRYFHYLQERNERIRKAVKDGKIVPINSTTFTGNENFIKCKKEGHDICAKAPFDAVIDVKKARDLVKPLPILRRA